MKKRILLAVMTLSLSIMLFGCGANTEDEKGTNPSNKTEATTEKVVESTTEETTEQEIEPTTEEITEPVTEVPATEEVNTEVENNFNYDFEGRYWVEYGEYVNGGYYFDGTNATVAYGENKSVHAYSVVDGFIVVTYEDEGYDEFSYYIDGNTLYLAMYGQERCFVDVDKAEFESLFN